jgi:parvulin-like peptidyl-prolyl isomerase
MNYNKHTPRGNKAFNAALSLLPKMTETDSMVQEKKNKRNLKEKQEELEEQEDNRKKIRLQNIQDRIRTQQLAQEKAERDKQNALERAESKAERVKQKRILAAEQKRIQNEQRQFDAEQRRLLAEQKRLVELQAAEQKRIISEQRRLAEQRRITERRSFHNIKNPKEKYNREGLIDLDNNPTDLYYNLINYLNDNGSTNMLTYNNPCNKILKCNPTTLNRTNDNKRCWCCYICNRKLPSTNSTGFLDTAYHCEHIIPFFSGAAFLGHNNPKEFAFAHARCNDKKLQSQNNDDLWGWDILERPYRDSEGTIHKWKINWEGVSNLRTSVDNDRKKNNPKFQYLTGPCNGDFVFTELESILNKGSLEQILEKYCEGLKYLALLHGFNPLHVEQSVPPQQNNNYTTCLNYANGNTSQHGYGNAFGSFHKQERNAFLNLTRTPNKLRRKFGKNANIVGGKLIEYLKRNNVSSLSRRLKNVIQFHGNIDGYTTPIVYNKRNNLSPRSPLSRKNSVSSSGSSNSFGAIRYSEEEVYDALEEVGESIRLLYARMRSRRVTVNIIYNTISELEYSFRQLDRVISLVGGKENLSDDLIDKINSLHTQKQRAIRRAHSKINVLEHGNPIPPRFYRFGKKSLSFRILQKDLDYLKKIG